MYTKIKENYDVNEKHKLAYVVYMNVVQQHIYRSYTKHIMCYPFPYPTPSLYLYSPL